MSIFPEPDEVSAGHSPAGQSKQDSPEVSSSRTVNGNRDAGPGSDPQGDAKQEGQNPVDVPPGSAKRTFRPIILTMAIPIGLSLLLGFLLPGPEIPSDPVDRARLYDEAGDTIRSMHEMRGDLEEHPNDIEYNRIFLKYLYRLPARSSRGHDMRRSEEIMEIYQKQCDDRTGRTSSLGCYFLGIMHREEGNLEMAGRYLGDAVEAGLPFAAVDLGILYEDQSNFSEATGKYRMELDREDPASRQEALRGLSRSLAGEGN
ncbi:MAG: hypothetical protein KDK25_14775, partial [Leptospiraceae bacterium]|nr:hypothetical protein [Leptospiraceae bacterium]